MTTPAVNSFIVNSDGSVSFFGYVWWPAGTNTASGSGVAVFGPGGATWNTTSAPFEAGADGASPTLTLTQVQVAYGDSLPGTNPAVVFTPASGGTPPNYDITYYVNAGAPGTNGTSTISSTLDGVAAQEGYLVGWDSTASAAQWQPIPVDNWYNATGISASASNTSTQKQVASIAVAARPYDWWPEARGQINVIGAVDTQVNAVARVGGTSGEICGLGYGAPGDSPPAASLDPFGLSAGSSNIVSAGSAATIYLYAENQTDSANAWSTTSDCFFQVRPSAVPL